MTSFFGLQEYTKKLPSLIADTRNIEWRKPEDAQRESADEM